MDLGIMLKLLHHLEQMRRHEYCSPAQVQAHQETTLRDVRAYADAHSPFYQRFHEGRMDRPLQDLPVLTKQMMMEHFDDLVTDRAMRLHLVQAHVQGLHGDERFLGRYWVNATSGSSGYPGIFLFNGADWVMVLDPFGPRLAAARRRRTEQLCPGVVTLLTVKVYYTIIEWGSRIRDR